MRYDEDSKKGKDSVIIISTFMGDFQGLCQCRGSRRWNL
jgi:hypothetical protein